MQNRPWPCLSYSSWYLPAALPKSALMINHVPSTIHPRTRLCLHPPDPDQSQSPAPPSTSVPSCAFSFSFSLRHRSVLCIWRRNLKLNLSVMKRVPICGGGRLILRVGGWWSLIRREGRPAMSGGQGTDEYQGSEPGAALSPGEERKSHRHVGCWLWDYLTMSEIASQISLKCLGGWYVSLIWHLMLP